MKMAQFYPLLQQKLNYVSIYTSNTFNKPLPCIGIIADSGCFFLYSMGQK